MVIQEAFTCGRPVIGSDIGGMAEKITHGVDGLHVPTGNAMQWGQTLYDAATTDGLWIDWPAASDDQSPWRSVPTRI